MPDKSKYKSTAQEFLDIYDITNDLVILKSGTAALIMGVSAMNFGLLAEEEQDAVIYTYAALLNSLNYPIQIIIQSQTKDVTKYLNRLKEKEAESTYSQRRERIARYREFVTNLVKERNVLDKKFFVAIPATALELELLSAESVIPGRDTFDVTKYEKTVLVDKAQAILEPRKDHLISQFARIGLASWQLTTQDIIRVFYTNYNPDASEGFEGTNTEEYQTAVVKASMVENLHSMDQALMANQAANQALDQQYGQAGVESGQSLTQVQQFDQFGQPIGTKYVNQQEQDATQPPDPNNISPAVGEARLEVEQLDQELHQQIEQRAEQLEQQAGQEVWTGEQETPEFEETQQIQAPVEEQTPPASPTGFQETIPDFSSIAPKPPSPPAPASTNSDQQSNLINKKPSHPQSKLNNVLKEVGVFEQPESDEVQIEQPATTNNPNTNSGQVSTRVDQAPTSTDQTPTNQDPAPTNQYPPPIPEIT